MPPERRCIMRVDNRGAFVRVTASAQDVEAFNHHWPCSSIPEERVSFTFDRRSGDLVDLSPHEIDGPEVVALSQDCQEHARSKGLLP
jgi:hypothetical protein